LFIIYIAKVKHIKNRVLKKFRDVKLSFEIFVDRLSKTLNIFLYNLKGAELYLSLIAYFQNSKIGIWGM